MLNYFNKINYVLFILVLILYPINHKFFLFVRPADVAIIILFFSFLIFYKINIDYILLLLLSFLFIFLSTFFSYSYFSEVKYGNFLFIYKILSIITIIACINHFSELKSSVFFHKLLFSLFIFQIIWVFIYSILLKFGLDGNIRVSYFLSNLLDRRMSDAHLYGNLLSLSLVFYLMHWRQYFSINHFITIIIVSLTLIAIVMTGSKNPLLILILYFLISLVLSLVIYLMHWRQYFSINHFITIIIVSLTLIAIVMTGSKNPLLILILYFSFFLIKKYRMNHKSNFLLKFSFVLCIAIYLFSNQIMELIIFIINYIESTPYQALTSRIYNSIVSPQGDDSIFGRIKNLYEAIDNTHYSFGILGIGVNGDFKYFDGVHSLIISLGGFALLITVIIYIAFSYIKVISSYKNYSGLKNYLIFFSLFLISNIITEFIFVNRWMIPAVSMLILSYLDCFRSSSEKKFFS